MRILAIDTSNQTLAVAVCEGKKILGQHTINVKKNHSLTLMPVLTQMMSELNLKPQEIDRIVVAQGPGSYTGLRIGVTTAKTLAYTLKKELVGISSLKCLAANCLTVEKVIVPIFDARRQNVYTGAYQFKEGKLENILPDRHIAMDEWLEQLKEKKVGHVYFVGEDCANFRDSIEKKMPTAQINCFAQWQIPNGTILADLGRVADPVIDVHSFSPNYLKRVEAEENWLKDNKEGNNYVEKI